MRLIGKILINAGFVIAVTILQPALSQEKLAPGAPYSLDEAVALVKRTTGGRILRADTLRRNDRTIHRIRIITPDGRVRTINVDSLTGVQK